MKILKDYHNLYLKCSRCVKLLADVFEKFRNNSLKNYRLFWSHYFSAPVLSWDAMLNMAKIKLELISDRDIYIFFDKGIEVEFLIFLIDIVKPTISVWNLMTQSKNQNIYLDMNNCMVFQCISFFQQTASNG